CGKLLYLSSYEIFIISAILPFEIILFLFSLFGKPEIDFERYRIYLALAVIVTIYSAICRIIEEFKQCR
ncbi:hypothetical protein CO110_03725, partial [Candidatus Desantisbacteria bacterium CG_4_9_14_3_um_filter_40_11]